MRLLCIALIMVIAVTAMAEVVNPWIVSDAKVSAGHPMPNTWSMEAFHTGPVFGKLKPKEFCRKLFEIYYDGRRKSWKDFKKGMTLWAHTAQEPRANAHLIEHDPVLLFNVHGTGYCGIQSGLLEGIYQSRPGGSPGKPLIEGRRWFLEGIVHSVADAFYDGSWHYYDIDIGGWAGDHEKDVWSVADVIADPEGYYTDKTPLRASYFFKADGDGAWVKKIVPEKSYAFQDNLIIGHEMAISLRKGESLTRYFNKAAAGWAEFPPHTKRLEKDMKGFVELVYAPTADQLEDGIMAKGSNWFITAIRCPYNITSSIVTATGTASVSHDLGRTWQALPENGAVEGAINHWDYLLRIENGKLEKVVTRAICHPAALPRTFKGKAKMTVSSMGDYQMLTWIPDWSTPANLKKTAQLSGLQYASSQKMTLNGSELKGAGSVTIPIPAPPGSKIVKVKAAVVGGTSSTPDPKKYLELYIGPRGKAKLVERSTDCSGWGTKPGQKVNHWQTNVNGSAAFQPASSAEVRVKVNGYGSVNAVRLFIGYVPITEKKPSGTLIITHSAGGKSTEQSIPAGRLTKGSVNYQVNSSGEHEYVRMEVK